MLLAVVGRPPEAEPLVTDTPRPSGPTASPSPTAAAGVPAACAADVRGETFAQGSLEERLARLRDWSASHAGRQASLVLTDQTLTESVRASLSAPDAPPFKDATVTIRTDGIRVAGTATAAFLRFPISAILVPSVADGRLRLAVTELRTGGLPGALSQRVNDLIAQAADPANWRLAMRVDEVVLRSGCGVIRGVGQAG